MFKLAFIGGSIHSIAGYPHLVASQMDNKFEVVAAAFSKDEEINKETSKLFGVKNIYSNWKDLLKKEKDNIDAVVILVPTNMHGEVIFETLKYDLPIICEKPLVGSMEESEQLNKIYDDKKHFLLVTNNYSGYPMVREIKKRIEENHFGNILNLRLKMPQESFLRPPRSVRYPQKWRLKDNFIPMISLDLGSHLHHLSTFLLDEEPKEVFAQYSNFSAYNVVDDVNMMVNYKSGISGNMWLSKTALGNRNGLTIELYGSDASAVWHQEDPETLKISYSNGDKMIVDRGSDIRINNKLYNRMTAGHPSGFIEAFANLYNNIYDCLLEFKTEGTKNKNNFVFGVDHAVRGLQFLHMASISNKSKNWEEVINKN